MPKTLRVGKQLIFTKMKKVYYGALALVFGLALTFAVSAFTPAETTVPVTVDQLWLYDGSGSVTSPSNYTPTSGVTCEGDDNICMISAPASSNPQQPAISGALGTRITNKDDSNNDVFLKN